jgi:hypothetical protein
MLALSANTVATQTKPNILVIFGDDVGYMNVSAFGGDIVGVQTPNIDSSCDFRCWQLCDVPRGAENVRSWRQTGSGRHTSKVTRLTHLGP